jgi:hypothetical protein
MAKRIIKDMKQAELINAIITSKGTSQAWVGRQIGRKQTAINRTINHGNMSIDMLFTILETLGYDIIVKDRNGQTEYRLVGENLAREGEDQ